MNIMCEKSDLGWNICTYRRVASEKRYPFVLDLVAGKVKVPSARKVASEKAAWLKSLRCHPKCREHAAKWNSASYADAPGYTVGADRCEVCGRALACAKGRTDHEYKELGQAECRKLGVSHFGNCYHVEKCIHCGDVAAYDSSD